ncbi:hypothetical protein N2382_09635 [SAR92 clade bacterium H921]|nr:hypothetical protein [SAR92 clade bacterium H921]
MSNRVCCKIANSFTLLASDSGLLHRPARTYHALKRLHWAEVSAPVQQVLAQWHMRG